MASLKRLRGTLLERPIVYGTVAEPLPKKNEHDHTHQWTVYVRGINNEDISYYIKKVQFKLHESFAQPNRVVEKFPFEVTETGWGEFDIQIKIFFQDPTEKPIALYHHLRLYTTTETVSKGQAVQSEYYDEIVFNEPTELMYEILTKNRALSVPSKRSETYQHHAQLEKTELTKLGEARATIQNSIRRLRQQYDDAEARQQRLSKEVSDLEARIKAGGTVST